MHYFFIRRNILYFWELNLIDVKSIIISEDKSSKFLYNEQEIEVKNILEWLNFD